MSKAPAQYLKLLDTHPTMVKIKQLHDLAEELGITISFYGGKCLVQDRGIPHLFELRDIEKSLSVTSFPYGTETEVVYLNPEHQVYLENKARASRESLIKATALIFEAQAIRKLQAEADEKARIELAEKAKLRELLAKYGTEGY